MVCYRGEDEVFDRRISIDVWTDARDMIDAALSDYEAFPAERR
jgi:hypothetical protein